MPNLIDLVADAEGMAQIRESGIQRKKRLTDLLLAYRVPTRRLEPAGTSPLTDFRRIL